MNALRLITKIIFYRAKSTDDSHSTPPYLRRLILAEATNVIIALADISENERDRYWMTIFQKLERGIYPFFYLNFL
jgi:hypothetical protein